MQLREGEQVLKTYHHHLFPLIVKVIEVALGSIPFYLIVYFAKDITGGKLFWAVFAVTLIFLMLLLHVCIDDRLDKLIITNQRVIFIDWKMIAFRTENEIDIKDIQEVTFSSRGVLAEFRMFNFGMCHIKTSSPDVSIRFNNASHPSEIRDFIFSLKKV